MNFDLENTRRDLIAMRVKHGANTPIGHRCSNLLEQLENLSKSTDQDQRHRLEKNISQTVAELAALSKGDR